MTELDRKGHARTKLLRLLAVFWLLFVGVAVLRLLQLQVFMGGYYRNQADGFQFKEVLLPGIRGEIFDTGGRCLAANHPSRNLYVEPKKVENIWRIAAVAEQLGICDRNRAIKKIRSGRQRVLLASMIDLGVAGRMMSKNLPGVVSTDRIMRFYPWRESLAHITGFVGVDAAGLAGLEKKHDRILAGVDGRIRYAAGASTGPDEYTVRPEPGSNLVLTIDAPLQDFAYRVLEEAVAAVGARSGSVVAIDPMTGAVRVACSVPSYDPNEFRKSKTSQHKLRAVLDTFEPGSTFKLVTMAAALDEGVCAPGDSFYCENGLWHMPIPGSRRTFRLRDDHKHETLSLTECLAFSSNIGLAKIAEKLGNRRLYEYSKKFGFGLTTGCGLEGEQPGILKPLDEWSGISLSRLAIGQELSVTTMQLAVAFSIIASEGRCMQPYIVKGVRDADGRWLERHEPRELRKPFVSPRTCRTLTAMLEQVVATGTGTDAAVPGLRTVGKTGTAEVMDRAAAPDRDKYNAVFAGFAPDLDPLLVVVVNINNIDEEEPHQGGEVAAPVFSRITEEYSRRLRIERERLVDSEQPLLEAVPGFRGMTVDAAKHLADDLGIRCGALGAGEYVSSQSVAAGTPLGREDVILYAGADTSAVRMVPDCVGLTARDAIDKMSTAGFRVTEISGSGVVIRQRPVPGETVEPLSACRLICSLKALVE